MVKCIGWCFPNFKIMVTSTEITTQLHAIVRGFVGKQIQDQDDCDDVVQKIFMNIHEKIMKLVMLEFFAFSVFIGNVVCV